MEKVDTKVNEPSAYQGRALDNVKIQEALTIIAIYAAQMDYQNCEADIKRIEAILEQHHLFVARKNEVFTLIKKFVNDLEVRDPQKALEIAAEALTPEQKNIGFELAVEVVLPDKKLSAAKKRCSIHSKSGCPSTVILHNRRLEIRSKIRSEMLGLPASGAPTCRIEAFITI